MHSVNSHVKRLKRHVSFDPNSNVLYDEKVRDNDSRVQIPTLARYHVEDLLRLPEVALIVLTGDAGHGKTHLCRQILQQDYGQPEEAIFRALDTPGMAVEPTSVGEGLRPIRVISDLTALGPRAGTLLEEMVKNRAMVSLVCANEGCLRDVVEHSRSSELQVILETLKQGLLRGVTWCEPHVRVINLNFQSVTSSETSFSQSILETWVEDRRLWKACRSCALAESCPIRANQLALGGANEKDAVAATRREAFEALLRISEQSGFVLTIRETLKLCAYTITGGLDCDDVARSIGRQNWAEGFEFSHLIFGRALPSEQMRQIPVLARLRQFDPGTVALCDVDNQLMSSLDRDDVASPDPNDRFVPPPRTSKEARDAAIHHRDRLRRARRRDFFDFYRTGHRSSEEIPGECARRLGLRHYEEFRIAVGAQAAEARRLAAVRDRLVDGLHVLQGIRPADELSFCLTDPAFTAGRGRAPILACRVSRSELTLCGLEKVWAKLQAEHPKGPDLLSEAMNWIPRRICLVFGKNIAERIELDLLQFEFVMRCADGIAFREFHGPEVRCLHRRLAQAATVRQRPEEAIEVIVGRDRKQISIDGDDFRVG